MRILFLFMLMSYIKVSVAQDAKDARNSQDYLEWNEFYELKWDDFEGKPGSGSRGDAGTVVQIKAKPFKSGRRISYDVYALFSRRKSWARDKSAALLKHEQLHFDIAELYARKIRQRITELQDSGEKDLSAYNAAVQELLEESDQYDIRYDAETLHGSFTKKQLTWEQNVEQALDDLKEYKKKKRFIQAGK